MKEKRKSNKKSHIIKHNADNKKDLLKYLAKTEIMFIINNIILIMLTSIINNAPIDNYFIEQILPPVFKMYKKNFIMNVIYYFVFAYIFKENTVIGKIEINSRKSRLLIKKIETAAYTFLLGSAAIDYYLNDRNFIGYLMWKYMSQGNEHKNYTDYMEFKNKEVPLENKSGSINEQQSNIYKILKLLKQKNYSNKKKIEDSIENIVRDLENYQLKKISLKQLASLIHPDKTGPLDPEISKIFVDLLGEINLLLKNTTLFPNKEANFSTTTKTEEQQKAEEDAFNFVKQTFGRRKRRSRRRRSRRRKSSKKKYT